MQKHATCPAKKVTMLSATRGAGLVQIANARFETLGFWKRGLDCSPTENGKALVREGD